MSDNTASNNYVPTNYYCLTLSHCKAISHLALSLRCSVLTNHYKMDLHFHLSQAYIARLQTVIDKIPKGVCL